MYSLVYAENPLFKVNFCRASYFYASTPIRCFALRCFPTLSPTLIDWALPPIQLSNGFTPAGYNFHNVLHKEPYFRCTHNAVVVIVAVIVVVTSFLIFLQQSSSVGLCSSSLWWRVATAPKNKNMDREL